MAQGTNEAKYLTLDRIARLAVPALLGVIVVLGQGILTTISNRIDEGFGDIEQNTEIIDTNHDLIQNITTANELQQQLIDILIDDGLDHETRIRMLEGWQRALADQ